MSISLGFSVVFIVFCREILDFVCIYVCIMFCIVFVCLCCFYRFLCVLCRFLALFIALSNNVSWHGYNAVEDTFLDKLDQRRVLFSCCVMQENQLLQSEGFSREARVVVFAKRGSSEARAKEMSTYSSYWSAFVGLS